MLKKIIDDLETTFSILKLYIYKLQIENKKLKEQIKMFQNDINEIIKSSEK